MKYLAFLIFCLILTPFTTNIFAHGAQYNIIEGGIGIEANYSESSPMSDSEVEIFSPDDHKEQYLKGFTDSNGRFMFSPHMKGEWIIKVSDGMGHALQAKINVDHNLKTSTSSGGSVSKAQMITMITCVIWGLIGTALYFKRKS